MARRSRRLTPEPGKSAFPLQEARRTLEERRARLLRRRAELEDERADLLEDEVLDTADAAVRDDFVDRFDQLEQGEFRELQAIDAALARIESGDYGFCARCGQPIGAGRLRAIPETPLCIRCAEPTAETHAPGEHPSTM